jgi:site-specific recombinase XerD
MEDLGYAPATRDQRISKVKAFFAWAHREKFLPSNPASHLKRPRQTWQPDPFSKEEVTRILDAAQKGRTAVRDYALVCMLLDTGIRASELCALTPENIDLSTGRIKVIDGKGGKDRTLMLGKRCKNALWRYQMQRPETWVPNLFVSERGAILHRTVLGRQIRIIGERAKVMPCYPHRFRHTFAVMYLKAGGDAYSLQYLLGHSDMAVTRQYVKLAAIDVSEMYRSPLDRL